MAVWIGLLVLSGPPVPALPWSAATPYSLRDSAQSQEAPQPLEPGKPIEREIAAGETHRYQIALDAAQYLHVSLDRQDLNLVMALFAPDGKKLGEVTRASYPQGPLPILLATEVAGRYGLEVRLPVGDKGPGRYKVNIEELRTATDKDRSRFAAERAFFEATQLREQGTAQSLRKSIEKREEALSLYRALADRLGEADALNEIGWAYSELRDSQKALDYYIRALPIYQAAGARVGEATVLNNIGGGYFSLSENRKALDYYNQALPIFQALGNRRFETGTLHNMGQIYASLGEWQKALEHFTQALSVVRTISNRRLEASVLLGIGRVYSFVGEHQKALDYYTQALPLHRESGNRSGEANALARIGRISRLAGENQKALDHYNQALSILRAISDRRGEASALRDIGQLYDFLGERQKALDYLNQALPILRAIGYRDDEAEVLNAIGATYTSLSEYQKALASLHQALDLYRSIGNPIGEVRAVYSIARAHRGQGNLAEARSHSEAALRLVESQRGKVASPESRASYFASVRSYYELNIDLLMRLRQQRPSERLDAAALETSERARARSLLELLAEARADIRQGVDVALLERERGLQELLTAKGDHQTRLLSGKHTPEQAAAAAKELETVLTEYQEVQARIRATSPRYAALTQPQPTSLKEIQQQILDGDTLLLEYALGDERSYLWAVSTDSLTGYELPKRAEIEAAARRFYELAKQADSESAQVAEAAAALSQMLLAPAADRLGSKRLVVVADGILHYVPFAALPAPQASVVRGPLSVANRNGPRTTGNGQKPLIVDHEIVILPSASVLAGMRRELAGRTPAARAVAVLADPVFSPDDPRLRPAGRGQAAQPRPPEKATSIEKGASLSVARDLERALDDVGAASGKGIARLPFSRREAEAITAVAPAGQTLKAVDFEANRAAALDAGLGGYRIVHFATHGLLNSRHPELSGIVLSLVDREGRPQEGFLRLHDVYNLKLPAELVVLSACQTGLGREMRGEGLVGLTRGFMYAGAARVVASLWRVDDAATAELMKRFYRGMFSRGLRPAAALREAQIETWKQERWRSPYFWAAFTLQGEWR